LTTASCRSSWLSATSGTRGTAARQSMHLHIPHLALPDVGAGPSSSAAIGRTERDGSRKAERPGGGGAQAQDLARQALRRGREVERVRRALEEPREADRWGLRKNRGLGTYHCWS
jgi:hypothetical protein